MGRGIPFEEGEVRFRDRLQDWLTQKAAVAAVQAIRFDREVDGELVRVHVRTDGDAPVFWSGYPPNGTIAS